MPLKASSLDSDRASAVVLICVITLFMVVVSAGWHRLLLPGPAGNIAFIAWSMAVAVAVFAVLLAWGVASQRRLKKNRTWWATFSVLFILSSLGTLNAIFYYGEGKLVLIENLDYADECLDRLEAAARPILTNPSYDEKRARVNQLQIKLEAEIRNPRNCGEGPFAIDILREIKLELPGFDRISVPNEAMARNCQTVEPLIKSYEGSIDRLLKTTPEYRDDEVEEKQKFATSMREEIKRDREGLFLAKAQLNTASLDDAKSVVEHVALTSTQYEVKIKEMAKKVVEVKCGIDLDAVRGLGSISQIIPLLVSRSDRISTYIYVLASIMADIILITCFAQVLRGSGGDDPPMDQVVREASDPKYLWVKP